jgi:hypothetical protein
MVRHAPSLSGEYEKGANRVNSSLRRPCGNLHENQGLWLELDVRRREIAAKLIDGRGG